jgi:type VI secretion system secreted protein VgrG
VGSADRSGADEEFAYANEFTCIPNGVPYRPPRVTPRPQVAGCQTATVVGPAGEEIFTDKYGRVKVQFRWDRLGKKDANSSCWVRVATFWAGRQWGAVHIPRIGQEVVVDFEEGDPDQPIIVGSVYNADNMPPYELPANKTQSGVKSRSTLQGAAEMFNELRFEDKKGSEQVFLQAQRDLDAVVKHDETRVVWHDRTTTILNHDTRNVGGKDKDGNEIGGNDVVTVTKGNRDVTVTEGNLTTTVGKNTTTTVGEHDAATIGKNQTLDVGEARTTTIGKDETLTVSGKRASDIGKDDELNVGKKLIVEAGDEIVLKTGMSKITMKKDGTIEISGKDITLKAMANVQIKAAMVKLNADGQAEIKSAMVKVQGDGMLQLKAPMSQLNGDGMLMAKGGITMIN